MDPRPRSRTPGSNAGGAIRPLKLVAFSLLPLVLLTGGIELGLRAAGIAPPPTLGAGFDLSDMHIVPDDTREGWRPGKSPAALDREPNEKLVVLLGGSNTQNFPNRQLQLMLDQRLAGTGVTTNVLNLGRAGFGSERVLGMFERSLELDPDLIVVYSGHNEIVEREFRRDNERAWSGWSGRLAGILAPLHCFQAFVAAFSSAPADGNAGNAPAERIAAEERKFEHYRLDDTIARVGEYRANLGRIADAARERGIPLVLSTVVFNMVSPPFVSNRPPDVPDELWRRVQGLLAEVAEAWPPSLHALDPKIGLMDRPYKWDWRARSPDPSRRTTVASTHTLDAPEKAIQPLWPAPERWSNDVQEFVRQMNAFWSQDFSAGDLSALDVCAAKLEEVQTLVPDLPEVLFRLGVTSYVAGDGARAAEYFDHAAECDRAPRKGTRLTNDTARAVAQEHGTLLFEAERTFRERFPYGIVGWEVMADHCHMHERGYALLMQDLADVVAPLLAEEAQR